MHKLQVRKYQPRNSILSKLIKYFWIIRTDKEVNINNILFPTNNIDFILNLSSPISYVNDKENAPFNRFHFRGIMDSCSTIKQIGILDIVGISFFPAGAYPFLKVPLSEFSNKTILLDDLFIDFGSQINSLQETVPDSDRIDELEKILLRLIDLSLIPEDELNLVISKIYFQNDKMKVDEYCNQIGISQKSIERYFKKYVGINPKPFIKLTRFQKALKQILDGNYDNLTSLSYDLDYFDQTHFIKDFKSYMGTTPLKFIKQKSSVKEMLENN